MLHRLSTVTLLFLTVALPGTHASKETMQACVTAQEVLYENIELSDAFRDMLLKYNDTCHEEGACTYKLHEDTLDSINSVKNLTEGGQTKATYKDIKGIKGTGEADFGGSFYDHLSFKTYVTACEDAGGDMVCVDADLKMEGYMGATFLPDDETGIETDVKLTAKSYPVCMTEECENEDMLTILENTFKDAFLKSDSIAEKINSQVESMIKAATVKQLCALSGLDTCDLALTHEKCSDKVAKAMGISGAMQSGRTLFTGVVVAIAMVSLF